MLLNISSVPIHHCMQVFNEFELETHPECAYDNLEIFDGFDLSGGILGKFCGSRRPEEVISSKNQMFLKFFSDASVQKRGFLASHTTGARYFYYLPITGKLLCRKSDSKLLPSYCTTIIIHLYYRSCNQAAKL